jgi:hypothetical protein
MINLSNFTQNLVKHKVNLNAYWCSEFMLELENNFDDEEKGNCNMILFHIFLFPPNMIYGLIIFLDHYRGHNCAEMYFVMHFLLSFGFGFYSCY